MPAPFPVSSDTPERPTHSSASNWLQLLMRLLGEAAVLLEVLMLLHALFTEVGEAVASVENKYNLRFSYYSSTWFCANKPWRGDKNLTRWIRPVAGEWLKLLFSGTSWWWPNPHPCAPAPDCHVHWCVCRYQKAELWNIVNVRSD